jgi:formiminotetrahydrofolate cyclodeaminase
MEGINTERVEERSMNESFLAALASPQPIPGGGAAAAYAASVGLALLEKIVRLEMQRREIPALRGLAGEDLLGKVLPLAETLARLRDEDGEAYLKWAKIKGEEQNHTAVRKALREATECPMRIVECIQKSLECVVEAETFAQTHLLSDLLAVCEIINGAGKGAGHVASTNLQTMLDPAEKNAYRKRLAALQTLAEQSFFNAREKILRRLNFS